MEELAAWPFRSQEASLWINSGMIEEGLESASLDWLCGDEYLLRESCSVFCLMFDQWCDFGMPVLHVRLLAGGDDFIVTSGGLPLGIDEWEEQYTAWWTGWRKYWDAKTDKADDATGEYEIAIPAGEPQPPDL
ncbi:MAG TPA: hypothetical protein VFE47_18840 [Tepidisphaeraceae bacterium]|nr:hypothetical protein [Tepidisphaeraceae bacterium]